MATEKQYQFFQSLCAEEAEREKLLWDRAKTNLSLTTLYSAFIIFVVEKLRPSTLATEIIFIAAVVFMLSAFLLSLWAVKVSTYEAAAEPRSIFASFREEPPTDEDFFDDRIVDFAVAYERNAKVNNRKARWLTIAGYCLLLGIGLHACYFILCIMRGRL